MKTTLKTHSFNFIISAFYESIFTMYRLLRHKTLSYSKSKAIESFSREGDGLKLCSHCNGIHFRPELSYRFLTFGSSDMQLMNVKTAQEETGPDTKEPKKKHQSHNRRKNSEILAIKGYSSSELRKEVSTKGVDKIAKDLNMLQNKTIFSLYSPKLNMKSPAENDNKHSNPFFEFIPSSSSERTYEDIDDPNDLKHPKEPKKSKKALNAENYDAESKLHDIACRTETVTRNLLAYLDASVNCGFLNKSYAVLMYYKHKFSSQPSKFNKMSNVEPFNAVMRGYATTGNFDRICEIMDIIRYDKIEPNVASYVFCFECVGRLNPSFQLTLRLKEWHRNMLRKNWTLQTLFSEGHFTNNQRELVLTACRMMEKDFAVKPETSVLNYNCSLLKSLDTTQMANSKRLGTIMNAKTLQLKAKEQMEMEKRGSLVIKSVEKSNQSPEMTEFCRKKLEQVQTEWRKTARESFFRNLNEIKTSRSGVGENITIYPFLKVLPPEIYVDIIMKEIRKLAEGSETFSPSLHVLFKEVGAQVQSMYQVHCKTKAGVVEKTGHLYQEYCDWFVDGETVNVSNTRVKWQQLLMDCFEGSSINAPFGLWPVSIQFEIGKFLYDIIMKDIKINVHLLKVQCNTSHVLPAFYSLYRSSGRTIKEEIKPHPVLAKLFRGAAPETLEFAAPLVPMLSPPIPWTDIEHGGHIIAHTEIMRLPMQAFSQWDRMKAVPKQQLYPAFDTLNQLGSIPWRINEPMLDLITKVFVSGGSSKLDIPEPPSSLAGPDQFSMEMTKEEKVEIYKQRLAVRRQKAEMYSLWCDTLYRLSLANHYRKEIFWFPHNMDFRGRVYPCPPHLSHMGSDLARSILCFAKGEPLGKHGLDWLKIHVINLTGLKKRESKAERLRYANEILPDILDSAENPLGGRKWWVESDEPWQTLAGCLEIAEALKVPNPEEYISYFPIHQDGSCNGLQHYAALGRDANGAESVNLAPAETPQDVYSCVVALVERERAKDALGGVNIAQVLDGFVKRKVIKQTVMTTVYGVTRYGARLQIAKQLKDVEKFPNELVWQASSYLVAKTFESLREMFTSTKEIQDWFTESARLISQTRGQNVEWVTPLGLPIVQPYMKETKKHGLNTKSKGVYINESFSMDSFGRPNVMKQKNAFPPNFIHSLDSSHMMLTSLYCEQQGITFVSVHDCFWTHPSTVDAMNLVCRQQFVALHSEPILEELSKSLVSNFSYKENDWALSNDCTNLNDVLSRVPPKGSFDLKKVLDSIYFFS